MPDEPRILTITPNPSLDVLFASEGLVWNDANRLPNPRIRPGGQGINLARAARVLGGESLAIAPLGGPIGAVMQEALAAEELLRAVPIRGPTRIFVEARDPAAGSLQLNPRGPALDASEARALEDAAREAISSWRPHFVVCCGSLVPGLPTDFYARIGAPALEAGAAFVPDCDGEALARSADLATVLAPNGPEAGRLLGTSVDTPEAAADAAIRLAESRPGGDTRWVAVTLGADGAVLATRGRVWSRPAPPVRPAGSPLGVGSPVGAGDAFLAALLVAKGQGRSPPDALALAVATGTAVLTAEGVAIVDMDDVRALRREVEVARPTD